jgi:hypothetical protein
VARSNHPGVRIDFAAGADVAEELAGMLAADFV